LNSKTVGHQARRGFKYTAPAAAGTTNIVIPGEGILFETDVYVTLSSATATVFYG
jgi:hypothetical protein